MEKKARQKKLEEHQKKLDAKIRAEMDERRKFEEDKKVEKELKVAAKRNEIESNIKVRRDNRMRSVQEMIERTRMVAGGKIPDIILRHNSNNALIANNSTPEMANLKNKKHSSQSKGAEDDVLRRNSQKYDDLIKSRREELRRKRGALDLNSDLDLDQDAR